MHHTVFKEKPHECTDGCRQARAEIQNSFVMGTGKGGPCGDAVPQGASGRTGLPPPRGGVLAHSLRARAGRATTRGGGAAAPGP